MAVTAENHIGMSTFPVNRRRESSTMHDSAKTLISGGGREGPSPRPLSAHGQTYRGHSATFLPPNRGRPPRRDTFLCVG